MNLFCVDIKCLKEMKGLVRFHDQKNQSSTRYEHFQQVAWFEFQYLKYTILVILSNHIKVKNRNQNQNSQYIFIIFKAIVIESTSIGIIRGILQIMIAEEIQEVVVQPILISKQENIARRNYKLVNWLKLLSLHDQNKDLKAGSEVIRNQIHQNYIMQQAFWVTEVNKRFAKVEVQKDDIELLMLAIEDGTYNKVATMLANKVIELYKQKKVTENYCLSILQKFINLFSYEAEVSQFFTKVREIYKVKGENRRIRNLFERQMKLAHDNFDLVWDQYLLWQTDQNLLQKNKHFYNQAKKKWQNEAVEFDQEQCSQNNVKLTIFMLQNNNESKIDQMKFLYWLQKLPTQGQKLWFLRRIALNFRQLIKPYLVKLQAIYSNDEQLLMRKYKVAIRLSENSKQIQLKYLHFLVRRISRHLLNEPLEQNYNDTWSAKVVFFRQEISAIIEKQRVGVPANQVKMIIKDYYKLWIQVESNIVKDKESVTTLYENIIKQTQDNTLFENYANFLLRIGAPKQAKNVLKRYIHHTNSDRSRQLYLSFIQMYGSIQDQSQFYKEQNQNANAFQVKPQPIQIEQEKANLFIKSNGHESLPLQSKSQSGSPSNEQRKLKRERSEIKDENEQAVEGQPKKRIHVDQNTIYIKGIPTSWTQQEVRNILIDQEKLVQIRLVVKNNQQKDYCYVVYNSKYAAEEEVKNNKSGYNFFMSKPPSDYDQSSTLFLCALPLSTNQQKIRTLFEDHQKYIKQIRLKLSNQKNYAYVQFQSEKHKNQAFKSVNKANLLIDGKKILIQHCDSSKSKSKKHSQNHVAFLKNISFKTTINDIKEYFAGKELLIINIPTNQEKRSKGFAYVEFEKQKDLQEVLQIKKGVMHGRQFQIFRSDREITTQKHHDSQNKERDETRSKHLGYSEGRERSQKKLNKYQKKEGAEVKDNNYFSSLFK